MLRSRLGFLPLRKSLLEREQNRAPGSHPKDLFGAILQLRRQEMVQSLFRLKRSERNTAKNFRQEDLKAGDTESPRKRPIFENGDIRAYSIQVPVQRIFRETDALPQLMHLNQSLRTAGPQNASRPGQIIENVAAEPANQWRRKVDFGWSDGTTASVGRAMLPRDQLQAVSDRVYELIVNRIRRERERSGR
jgi:hypothetical protein